MEITLNHGKKVLFDDEDAPLVANYRWYATKHHDRYYARTNLAATRRPDGTRWRPYALMHQLILKTPPGYEVDHINRDGLDNRRCNLRAATRSQNNANSRPRRGKKYKGVFMRARLGSRPWQAAIKANHHKHFLGYFATAEQAARAYDAAARRLFGEFARPNFPEEQAT